MNNLDRAVNNDFLIVSKSLLPYLNIDKQRAAAIFIKVMELAYTANLFSDETSVRSMSRSQETGWEKDFLRDLRENLPSDKAYFVDVILKLSEAKDLLTHLERPDSNTTEPQHRSASYPYAAEPGYNMHPADSGVLENMPFPDENSNKQTSSNHHSNQSNGPTPEQIINGLSSLLNPNQSQLLKAISSMLTSNHSKEGS